MIFFINRQKKKPKEFFFKVYQNSYLLQLSNPFKEKLNEVQVDENKTIHIAT